MDSDHDSVCSCASCPPPFFLCVLVPKVADMTRHTPLPEFLPACRHDTDLVTMATAASTGWCYRGWWWWWSKSKWEWERIWLPCLLFIALSSPACLFQMTLTPTIHVDTTLNPSKLHFHGETKRGFLLTFTMDLPFLLIIHFFSFINCTTLFPFVIMACRTVNEMDGKQRMESTSAPDRMCQTELYSMGSNTTAALLGQCAIISFIIITTCSSSCTHPSTPLPRVLHSYSFEVLSGTFQPIMADFYHIKNMIDMFPHCFEYISGNK